LQHQIVVVALINRRHQLVAHFVGVGAADVIALEKNLAASAGAHHAVAEIFKAGIGVARAQKEKQRRADDNCLKRSPQSRRHPACCREGVLPSPVEARRLTDSRRDGRATIFVCVL
jgi:hypothetical protein